MKSNHERRICVLIIVASVFIGTIVNWRQHDRGAKYQYSWLQHIADVIGKP